MCRLFVWGSCALVQRFSFPDRHRSGLLAILLLLLITPSTPKSQVRLEQVKQQDCGLRPDFAPLGHNERRVSHLIATRFRGRHAIEFYRLIESIEQDPLHQQMMETQATANQPSATSSGPKSSAPAWRRLSAGSCPTSRQPLQVQRFLKGNG